MNNDPVPGIDDLDDISIHEPQDKIYRFGEPSVQYLGDPAAFERDPRIRSPRKYSGGSFVSDLASVAELQKMLDDKNRLSLAEVLESINKEAKV